MSTEQEETSLPRLDLVHIDLTVTRQNAVKVVTGAVDALEELGANFASRQIAMIGRGLPGPAVYTNHQLGKILEAQVAAQQLLDKLTTQGE